MLLAAVLWGSMGLFYKQLMEVYGLPAITVVFFRAALSAVFMASFLVAAWKLRGVASPFASVTRRDLAYFALFGLTGLAGFYVVYINAIAQVGVGVAAVLMYTAPAWVTATSALLLGERLTGSKALALALAIAGAALVARAYRLEDLSLNAAGLLYGLGAGLGYGIYILFNKVAVRRHAPWTVLVFAWAFGALFMLPFQSAEALAGAVTNPGALAWLLGVTLIATLASGVSFNLGLRDVPASNASIVATIEPVVAMILGGLIYSERLDPPQLLGGALILGAVILLTRRPGA
mgnify:CR=1 FL=1